MKRPYETCQHAPRSSRSIQGQLLRLSEHRAVAIYLREGSTWVADFVDGQGLLVDVGTWVRFNCGTFANSHASRRIARESAMPVSPELAAQIESLHQLGDSHRSALARGIETLAALVFRGRLAMGVAYRWRCISRRSHPAR